MADLTCETHCETFVEKDEFVNLNKLRCIIGVWAAWEVNASDFMLNAF